MNDWKYIKTIDDLPKEEDEYLVVFRDTDEAHQFGCIDYVTVATFECDQKLWRFSDNWYLNPFVALNCNDRSARYISHWMKMPKMPEDLI